MTKTLTFILIVKDKLFLLPPIFFNLKILSDKNVVIVTNYILDFYFFKVISFYGGYYAKFTSDFVVVFLGLC